MRRFIIIQPGSGFGVVRKEGPSSFYLSNADSILFPLNMVRESSEHGDFDI